MDVNKFEKAEKMRQDIKDTQRDLKLLKEYEDSENLTLRKWGQNIAIVLNKKESNEIVEFLQRKFERKLDKLEKDFSML